MRFKEYRSTHKELWQRFVTIEPKPKPYDEEEPGLFWTVILTVVVVLIALAWGFWYGPQPLTEIFPRIGG